MLADNPAAFLGCALRARRYRSSAKHIADEKRHRRERIHPGEVPPSGGPSRAVAKVAWARP